VARVLVLYGGRSAEHPVSCLSARAVLAALDGTGHEVVPVGITRDGRWTLTDGVIAEVADGRLPEVDGSGPTTALVAGGLTGPDGATARGVELVVFDADGGVARRLALDVAFPVLHGPGGEDGTVQGLLASVGLPYVGADVAASAIGIDKGAMKGRFRLNGLPQVAYLAFGSERWRREPDVVREELARIPLPWFVKPARQGSSIGITRVDDPSELADAIAEAAAYDDRLVVEEGLEHLRELEVGVLESDGRVEVSCVGEIVPVNRFYDFDAKYLTASRLDVPADVDPATAVAIEQVARRAFTAIGGRGMARIDLFLAADGRLLLNEINTIPGFTEASMFPRVWAASGVDFRALVERLLATARV
jgi:D-alanine-D-alanine ligase